MTIAFRVLTSRLVWVGLLCALVVGGCGDFFDQKSTELQSRSIIQDLSRIETVPDPNIQVPEIYTKPPEILETDNGIKLFYFSKYHAVDDLSSIIKEQLSYKVTISSAINQLIIECTSKDEALMALEFLARVDVPPIQVRIDCMVSELYSDVTMDWETSIKIDNLLGSFNLRGKPDPDNAGEYLPAFPGASLREPTRNKLGLKVGYSEGLGVPGHEFNALVDVLVSRGYLKILLNPSVEVVNGQKAMIQARDNVPMLKEVSTRNETPYNITEYQWVTDSLEITPHVYADGYIGLETRITIGSKSTPEGVVQIPIITERMIQNGENRIRQGQSMIIGGLRKVEKRSVVRGVPFLKDLPIIGILFSSKDFEERAKEILFIITPTISNYGVPNKDMVKFLQKKHEAPVAPEEFHEAFIGSVGDFIGGKKESAEPSDEESESEAASLPIASEPNEPSQTEPKTLSQLEVDSPKTESTPPGQSSGRSIEPR
ncbi:MAG: type II and III secretion system protein [Phycisphaerae bacterium]|nr:type II and III secretion system protein [Phycisphaerae bacterium]